MPTADDRRIVAAQLRRPPRALRGVASRCAYGYPVVSEQEPFTETGEPFPTTYYLTCPWLVEAISRLEAAGGVARFGEAARSDPELAESLARADREQRLLRPEHPVGIAGSHDPLQLKCLHAHAAFALARPGYVLGERILAEAGERVCPDMRCSAQS